MAKGRGFCRKDTLLVGVLSFSWSSEFFLASKLKALKVDLKRWNVEEFGNVEEKGKKLWSDLQVTIKDSHALTVEEILDKERISEELEKMILLEEIFWRKKSRVFCIKKY